MGILNIINNGSPDYYNYETLVRKVYNRTANKKDIGFGDNIKIVDYEYSKRVMLESNNRRFLIVYFIVEQDNKKYKCGWTLYKISDKNESIKVSAGETTVLYRICSNKEIV